MESIDQKYISDTLSTAYEDISKIKNAANLLMSSWKSHHHICTHAFTSRVHYRQLPLSSA